MSVADEITALNTNLQAAKSAVTVKGGTVGDTGLAGLASEIASIPSGGGQDTLPVEQEGMTGDGHITAYDYQTGVITGDGFGSTAGTVWLLDRDTHSYKKQATSSWSDTSITLTTPVDTSVIEGYTSMGVEDAKGIWTTKVMINGDITPTEAVTIFYRSKTTGLIEKFKWNNADLISFPLKGQGLNRRVVSGSVEFSTNDVVGVMINANVVNTGIDFLRDLPNLNQPIKLSGLAWNGSGTMRNCRAFNQPVEFAWTTVRAIGDYFMNGCYKFNQPIVLNTYTAGAMGQYFLASCYNFAQPIVIPSTTTSIGNYFLSNTACPRIELHNTSTYGSYFLRFLSSPYTIDVQTNVAPPSNTQGSIYAENASSYTYIDGITIKGPYRQAWLDLYQDSSSSPYRHIIDGGE